MLHSRMAITPPPAPTQLHEPISLPYPNSNTHIEEEINRLRAEMLRKDQDNERMALQLAEEKEERERAQVGSSGWLAHDRGWGDADV